MNEQTNDERCACIICSAKPSQYDPSAVRELIEAVKRALEVMPHFLEQACVTEEDEEWIGWLRAALAKLTGGTAR